MPIDLFELSKVSLWNVLGFTSVFQVSEVYRKAGEVGAVISQQVSSKSGFEVVEVVA